MNSGSRIICFFIFTIYFLQICTVVSPTKRPIIGIVAQELPHSWHSSKNLGYSYVAASYVKAVESSGARVVPILINQTELYYRDLLSSINGVVVPGGSAPLKHGRGGFYDATFQIYKIAKELNDNKLHFPILGICLGMEALLTGANNHNNIQTVCDVFHENYPLHFLPTYKHSLLYSGIPERVFVFLKYFDVTVNNHIWCTTPENFTKSSLKEDWIVTTDNVNKRGLKFISSVEHKKYPFVGLQFHPEKPIFEWAPSMNNPHSSFAIQSNRYFYDFLTHQAKLNNNKFKSDKEEYTSLIYNYLPIYSETITHDNFEQIYVF